MIECLEVAVTCDLLDLHRAAPDRYPYLLESVSHGSPSAHYDILFAFPEQTLELDELNILQGAGLELAGSDFLAGFDAWWAQNRVPEDVQTHLPFQGGWFVYLGYELAAQIEPRLEPQQARHPGARNNLPTAFATRIPAAFIKDHDSGKLFLIAEPDRAGHLDAMRADLKALNKHRFERGSVLSGGLAEEPPQRFLDGVQRILNYIKEGDVFQVNLSRAWQGHLREGVDAAQIYARLREQNPAPFAGLACHGNAAIISSSPERLVSVRNGIIETRPIAGTHPRNDTHADDLSDTQALLAHPKERAEHIMLIDLERNDLGRVCEPGSVTVNELMAIESYTHVHHIVSNIRGRLRTSITPGQVLRAVFPGGTITGCPKVRCMEIIAELEQTPRGAYTGSMGYINRDGSMDFNILIRTLTKNDLHISLRAGAGIVADSDRLRELAETRAKARGVILALE